jgi:hypothetical protein
MNLYFLVEGRSTEAQLYPKWLAVLLPKLTRVKTYQDVTQNNYVLVSGDGYPQILQKPLSNSIAEINERQNFRYLILCLDAEEVSVDERLSEVKKRYANGEQLHNADLVTIVQNRCIETWLLGNRRIYKRNPENEQLREFVSHYDVSQHDPEEMPLLEPFPTHAAFHKIYLRKLLEERSGGRGLYSKTNTDAVGQVTYLEELRTRVNDEPTHLRTFRAFLELCANVKMI